MSIFLGVSMLLALVVKRKESFVERLAGWDDNVGPSSLNLGDFGLPSAEFWRLPTAHSALCQSVLIQFSGSPSFASRSTSMQTVLSLGHQRLGSSSILSVPLESLNGSRGLSTPVARLHVFRELVQVLLGSSVRSLQPFH